MKSARKLDDFDRKILAYLWRDARTSNRKIAKGLKVSEGTIRARIKRMEQANIIRITAVTNVRALRRSLFAFIGIAAEGSRLQKIADALRALPEIRVVSIMLGRYEILALAQVGTPQELAELIGDTIGSIAGVRSCESWQGLQVIKHDHRFGLIKGEKEIKR